MSATTLIRYNSKGFWINANYIQLLFSYLFDEAKKTQYIFSNKEDLLDDFEEGFKGWYKGYFSLSWNEILETTSDVDNLIQVLETVRNDFRSGKAYIPVSELQLIPAEDDTFKYLFSRNPFPTAELVKIIDALIEMLEGTWEPANYNMEINYRY